MSKPVGLGGAAEAKNCTALVLSISTGQTLNLLLLPETRTVLGLGCGTTTKFLSNRVTCFGHDCKQFGLVPWIHSQNRVTF